MKLTKTEINCTTGEVKVLELTEDELEQRKIDQASALAKQEERTEAELKKAAAEAKLAALGLTPDDLKALGI